MTLQLVLGATALRHFLLQRGGPFGHLLFQGESLSLESFAVKMMTNSKSGHDGKLRQLLQGGVIIGAGGVGQGKPTLVSVAKAEGLRVVAVRATAQGADGRPGPPADVGVAGKEGVKILPGSGESRTMISRRRPSPARDSPSSRRWPRSGF